MLTDLPAMVIALAATPSEPGARCEVLVAGPSSLGEPLLRDIGIRGATTAPSAVAGPLACTVAGSSAAATALSVAGALATLG